MSTSVGWPLRPTSAHSVMPRAMPAGPPVAGLRLASAVQRPSGPSTGSLVPACTVTDRSLTNAVPPTLALQAPSSRAVAQASAFFIIIVWLSRLSLGFFVEWTHGVRQGAARDVARVEHMAARQHLEPDPPAVAAERRQLVERELGGEIGRHQIGEAVHDERPGPPVERQRIGEVAERPGLATAGAPVPAAAHLPVEQMVAPLDPVAEFTREIVDTRAGERRDGAVEHGIVEIRPGREGVRVEPRDVAVVIAADPLAIPVQFAHEAAHVDPAGEPAHEGLVEAGEAGHFGDETLRRLPIARAAQEIGEERPS